jgi:octaprenyl-diphosphate synthase
MTTVSFEDAKNIAGEQLAHDLKTDTLETERLIRQRLFSDVGTVSSIGSHVLEGGGKRLRPLLVNLSARATGEPYVASRVYAIGACVEMIHMATLVHDDVIDQAETRRGRPVASAIWGPTESILTGDVLLAKAMEILADDGDLGIIRAMSKAVVDLAEGEVLELETRGNFELDQEVYYKVVKRKTAGFMSTCCRMGAQLASLDSRTEQALAEYGECLGMAFQIVDDILDYVGDHQVTGKPRATDFREGCVTLPLIALRNAAPEDALSWVKSCFGREINDNEVDSLVQYMVQHETYAHSAREAERFAHQAIQSLSALPDTPVRSLLIAIAEFVTQRQS